MSKRALVEAESEVCILAVLPPELIVEIARHGDWRESGPLARCSSVLMRLFLHPSVISQIVDSCVARRVALPRWLFLALVEEDNRPADLDELLRRTFSALASLASYGSDGQSRGPPWLLSGGSLAQMVYRREWEADLDIFIKDRRTRMILRRMSDDTCVDLIPVRGSALEQCIEDFDLSIVQQAVRSDGVYFSTPLARYSRQTHTMVVLPDSTNICYADVIVGWHEYKRRFVDAKTWEHIERHEQEHLTTGPFHYCWRCYDDLGSHHAAELLRRWLDRVAHYTHARFPDFTVVYARRPNLYPTRSIKEDKS